MKKILFTAITLFSISLQAQGIPSEGRDFYLGFIYPPYNDVVYPQTAGYFRVYAYVSSFEDNIVSVSYFDPLSKNETAPNNYAVKARQTTQIPLDRTQMTMRIGDTGGEFKSCHITSKKPISIQYFSSGANSGGSYLALPVNAWGKEYTVASYNDNGPGNGAMLGGRGPSSLDKSGGVFMIIAAHANTKVTITPTARTTGNHTGVYQGAGADGTPKPYTVDLQRGQCWLVKSRSAVTDDGEDDISASHVNADKPVAVIAGHENAYVYGSDVGGYSIEARDFMIEQMIPVEYWDHTGYIAIPMMDFPGATEGIGEHARVYVHDHHVPADVVADAVGRMVVLHPQTYATPAEVSHQTKPAHYSSADSTKFAVMQYDIRMHGAGTAGPFPSPTMTTVVPRSHWRNAYIWYVPSGINEKMQSYFVTIIAPKDGEELFHEPSGKLLKCNWFTDSLSVSVNGSSAFKSILALSGEKKKWVTIPGHPDLQALTYSVSPGTSYFIKAPFPFMVYIFGNRGVDYDGDIGDFDGDDNFFSYASPAGMALSTPAPKRIGVQADTLCSSWYVCARDSNTEGGIRSITLLDDAQGNIVIGGNYAYKNVSFDAAIDPLHLKEITLDPPQNLFCFDVRVSNPGEDAYAPLYIVDVKGNARIETLVYKKAAVEFIPNDTTGLVFSKPTIGDEVCREYLFVNKSESLKAYTTTKLEISGPSNFRISDVTPPLGSTLMPGQTQKIVVCFKATDTLLVRDSIDFATDCFAVRLPLVGQGGTGIIEAYDRDFHTILVGLSKCSDVEVHNLGNKAFTLEKNWVLTGSPNFTFDTAHVKNALPLTLQPGQSHKFWFCYTPTEEGRDTARMQWSSDIPEPFTHKIRSFSILVGAGVKPGVNWDRPTEKMVVGANLETLSRVYLINNGTFDAQLTRIWVDGPDADEYSVVATEHNTNPPTWGGTILPIGDTMWVNVEFKVDTTKVPMSKLRIAFLRTSVTADTTVVPTVNLIGEFVTGGVIAERRLPITMRPNPAHDKFVIDLPLEESDDVTIAIYDVLGREVAFRMFGNLTVGMNTLPLELPDLRTGMYVVSVAGKHFRQVEQLVIE